MKQSATVFMVVLTASMLANSEAVCADSKDMVYWPYQLPVVKENKTEIGLGKYLGGTTLLLLQSGVFQKYWPDYGYAWTHAEDPGFCVDILDNQVRKNADIGKVRLVTPNPENQHEFVGIDLTPRLTAGQDVEKRKNEFSSPTKRHPVKDYRVTLESFCEMIQDEKGKIWLQAAVAFARDNAAIGLPANAIWQKVDTNEDVPIPPWKKYKLAWRGTIIEETDGANGKETWKLGDSGKAIAWQTYTTPKLKELELAKELAEKGVNRMQFSRAFEWSPEDHINYYLFVAGQRGSEELPNEPFTLAVNDSKISNEQSLVALESATDLQIWSEIDPDVQIEPASIADLWFVTEYPIPSYDLEPSLRLQGYRPW